MQAVHVRDRCAFGTSKPRPLVCPRPPSLAEWQSCDCSCPARLARVCRPSFLNPSAACKHGTAFQAAVRLQAQS